jgi:hypothetical protein
MKTKMVQKGRTPIIQTSPCPKIWVTRISWWTVISLVSYVCERKKYHLQVRLRSFPWLRDVHYLVVVYNYKLQKFVWQWITNVRAEFVYKAFVISRRGGGDNNLVAPKSQAYNKLFTIYRETREIINLNTPFSISVTTRKKKRFQLNVGRKVIGVLNMASNC